MHKPSIYKSIFCTNILRLLEEKGWSKEQLAYVSGISFAFISDLTKNKANPSLRIMEQLAEALETPLAELLITTDLDKNSLESLTGGKLSLPEGFERVYAVLPMHQAFIVRKWSSEAQKKIKTS